MIPDQKFLEDWAEVLSFSDEVKTDIRLGQAQTIARRYAGVRGQALIRAEEMRNEKRRELELNRLVPQFRNYVLIGRASIARILPNATQISLATIYAPSYRGDFFLVDNDTVTRRTYLVKDINDRQQLSFHPPLGGAELTQPWLIGTIYGAPILSLEQANIVIEQNRRP